MLIDRSQQATCRARPPRKLQLVLLSTLYVTSSVAHARLVGSCSSVALQGRSPRILRSTVACAGGAQMHRLLLLCTKRPTSWTAFGDDYRSVHLCSTAVHLASPAKMLTEQRRVRSRQGDWHLSVCVSFCNSNTSIGWQPLLVAPAVTQWQAASCQDQPSLISTLACQATGKHHQSEQWLNCARLLPYEVQVANSHKPVSAVDQSALQQRTQASLQSVPSDSSAVHLSCRLVCLSPSGRHAKQHATADLVSCTGSCWH